MFVYVILLIVIFINFFFLLEKATPVIQQTLTQSDRKLLMVNKSALNSVYTIFNKRSKFCGNLNKLTMDFRNNLIAQSVVNLEVLKQKPINLVESTKSSNSLNVQKIESSLQKKMHGVSILQKSMKKATSINTRKPLINSINLFLFEMIYNVILAMVKNTIGGSKEHSVKFFPMVLTLFLFVLLSNILGLIPYSSTLTAYIIITLSLSIMVMFACTFYAFQMHGSNFIGFFLPSGCPGWLIPILVPIELISYIFRVVSLAVRLFANMMAGHTLLAVIAGFGWAMATGGVMLFIVHPFPIAIVFVLVGLETAVALIQAYVFAILTCIYFDEAINMH